MNLVIVESPTKAKTISKFLGKDYKVESSFGHVRDLPKSKLGVDVEHNFEPQYVIPTKSRKLVNQLKKDAANSDEVILATDGDREGEAIAWHLIQALGLNELKTKNEKRKINRIVFHEITKTAIENALKNPRDLNTDLVNAQQARRILDRLVGYELSPFLWQKVARGLSAGRVQSVAVRLIVDRENEIRNFKPEEYWTVVASLLKIKNQNEKVKNEGIDFNLVKIDGKALEKFDIKNKEQAEGIVNELKSIKYQVLSIEKKEISKNPFPPFITSTMQQEAAHKMGFSSKKTMLLAQRLYENGYITYIRTDSVNLSQDSTAAAKEWLAKELGPQYALESPRIFTAKSKLAQEAHEAVRPTRITETPENNSLADEGEKKLYRLIWQRFMASQMPNARISTIAVEILAEVRSQKSKVKSYGLRATGQQIAFDGYLRIYPTKFTEKEIPELKEGEELGLKEIKPEQHFTEPPGRYSEATIIKALEEHGIGRPSTYAPTISTIQTRNYVQKESGKFHPTEIGEVVNKVLIEHFPQIVDIDFTAKMEDQLDEVAHGREKWQELIGNFYGPFAKNLEEKYAEVKTQKPPDEKTDIICDKCGKPMVIKTGRFGRFIACTGFPDCKNTKQLAKEAPKSTGLKCPKCLQGEIIEKHVSRGRARGKLFWGCSRYPDCDYATWENPTKTEPKIEIDKTEKNS